MPDLRIDSMFSIVKAQAESTSQTVLQVPCFISSTNTSSLYGASNQQTPKPLLQQAGIFVLVLGQSKAGR